MKISILKHCLYLFIIFALISCKKIAGEGAEIVVKNVVKNEEKQVAKKTLVSASKEGGVSLVKKETKEKLSTNTAARLATRRMLISSRNQFVTEKQYLAWLENPNNIKLLKLNYPKDGRVLRYNMQQIMQKNYSRYTAKTATEAHHIVAVDGRYPSSKISQDILKKFNIDINDPMNGIFLPQHRLSVAKGAIHRGGHTKTYNDIIAQRLQIASSKEECYQILDAIKIDLYRGRIPLYNDPKVINNFSSFK